MTATPTNLTVSPRASSGTSVMLGWGTTSSEGLGSFRVLWRPVGAPGWMHTDLPTTARSYVVNALDPKLEYEFKVESFVYGGTTAAVRSPAEKEPPPPSPPVNTKPPVIVGAAETGVILNASVGAWTNSPTLYTYQWFLNGAPISGATGQTYAIPRVAGEAGHTITVAITATNAGGVSAPALSAATAPIVEHVEPPPTEGTWRGFGPVVPASFVPWNPAAFINQDVPANPVVLANSAAMCLFVSPSDVWTDGGYDHPVFFAKATDPLVEVTGVLYGTWANGSKIRCPAVAHPAPGSDHHMSVVQPDGSVFDFWSVQNNGISGGKLTAHGAGYASSLATSTAVSEREAGATASGFNNACGTVRVEELAAGLIPHALFIPCRVTKAGSHKAPAKGGDGTSTDPNSPQQGQRFYLAYSDAEIAASGWPRWKKTMVTAMAKKGLYCGDSGGGFVKFWGQQSYTAYGLPQPFNELLKNEPGVSTNVGLGGPCLVLHLHEGVDWTRLRALA